MRKTKCGCSPTVGLFFAISACCILIVLTVLTLPRPPMEETSYARRRTILYENMAKDLEKHGARFLDGGSTSQLLALSDIFKMKNGNVEPILKPADPAVRAVVLHLDPQYADPISNIALPSEVNEEARAVNTVAGQCCELSIVLERVVLTSTGVLLGCWQVSNGTDPAVIRNKLQKALPHAPAKQLYNEVMLHTSFARLLGPPAKANPEESSIFAFRRMVSQLNEELHQHKALVKEMWFVEEFDVLALALRGRINKHRFPLQCEKD